MILLLAGIAVVLSLGALVWACIACDDEDAIRRGYERENEADFQSGFDR